MIQTRTVRGTFLSAIESLVRTIEARDPYIVGHSHRVGRLALQLASEVGLDARQRGKLALAAKLHDIGKVAIPEAILNKPDRLTPEEEAVVRLHPLTGHRILTPIIRDRQVLAAVRGHHERLDGTGYPDGLQGSQVGLLTRILSIADVFDALTSCRAYRQALPAREAFGILRAGAGWHFDPALVTAFTAMISRQDRGATLTSPRAEMDEVGKSLQFDLTTRPV
jgi:HD-GYP domain-containing protein (c-di-GMP phosphodiesterase class II)